MKIVNIADGFLIMLKYDKLIVTAKEFLNICNTTK